MKDWLKHNAALALGVGLPVLLAVFFMLAAWLPKFFVEPPRYDALFLVNYNPEGANTIHYELKDKRLKFSFHGENYQSEDRVLYRYSPKTGEVQRTVIPIDPKLSKITQTYSHREPIGLVTPISMPDIEALTVDGNLTAPDGYMFREDFGHAGGLMGDIFYSPYQYSQAAITKNGNIVHISDLAISRYYRLHFIGWVIP